MTHSYVSFNVSTADRIIYDIKLFNTKFNQVKSSLNVFVDDPTSIRNFMASVLIDECRLSFLAKIRNPSEFIDPDIDVDYYIKSVNHLVEFVRKDFIDDSSWNFLNSIMTNINNKLTDIHVYLSKVWKFMKIEYGHDDSLAVSMKSLHDGVYNHCSKFASLIYIDYVFMKEFMSGAFANNTEALDKYIEEVCNLYQILQHIVKGILKLKSSTDDDDECTRMYVIKDPSETYMSSNIRNFLLLSKHAVNRLCESTEFEQYCIDNDVYNSDPEEN